jgi:hypothetical protein
MLAEKVPNVIITSAMPPSIKDNELQKGKVGDARNDVKISQLKRTALTLDFNRECERFCEQKGLIYVEVTMDMLTDGIVDDYYQTTNFFDHHFDNLKMAKLFAQKLNPVLENI